MRLFSLSTLFFFALSIFFSGLVSLYYAVNPSTTLYAVAAGLFVCVVSEKLMIERGQSPPKSKAAKLYCWLLYFVCLFTFVVLFLPTVSSDGYLLVQIQAQAIMGSAAISSLLSIAVVAITSSESIEEADVDVEHSHY